MPTPNPRLSVVVTPHQRDVLGALGAHQGRSAASYLRTILDSAMPHLVSLLALLDHASKSTGDLPKLLGDVSAEIARRMEPFEETNAYQLDLIADILEKAGLDDVSIAVADMIPRERSEAGIMAVSEPEEASRPPYCNTGVRKPSAGGKRRKSAISAKA